MTSKPYTKRASSEIDSATILDPLDIPFRIGELRQLKLGWLDGQGIPPTHDGLDWLSQSFYSSYADDAPLPYLYPTPEGRVLAEWSHKPWSSSLTTREPRGCVLMLPENTSPAPGGSPATRKRGPSRTAAW